MLSVEYCMDMLMNDMIPSEIEKVLSEENTESCKKALERLEFDLTKFGSFDDWRNGILQDLEEWNYIHANWRNNPHVLMPQLGELHEEIPIILCA